MSNSETSSTGPMIEGFTDLELIGSGGFGSVYRARQPSLNRTVAVKVLHNVDFDDRARRRFEREQQTMGGLSQHSGIVTLHQSGFTAAQQPYLVMEYMDEGSLATRLADSGPMGISTPVGLSNETT